MVFADKDVVAATKSYIPVMLILSKNKSMGRRFKVQGAPALLVIQPSDGKKLLETYGGDEKSVVEFLSKPFTELVKKLRDKIDAAKELLEAGKAYEAYVTLQKASKELPWSTAAKDAQAEMDKIKADKATWAKIEVRLQEEAATKEWARAQKLLKAKEYGKALALCDGIARRYPKAPTGATAKTKAAEIRADEALMKQIRAKAQESRARSWWNMASSMLSNNMADKAKEYLEKIVKECPDTKYAQMAKDKLAEIE